MSYSGSLALLIGYLEPLESIESIDYRKPSQWCLQASQFFMPPSRCILHTSLQRPSFASMSDWDPSATELVKNRSAWMLVTYLQYPSRVQWR